jgi:hypothetical protein
MLNHHTCIGTMLNMETDAKLKMNRRLNHGIGKEVVFFGDTL